MSTAYNQFPSSDKAKRGYSFQEISNIYELGRFFLENGDIHRGEAIMLGLTHVAPEFMPSWLGLAYVNIHVGNFEQALQASRQAYRLDPDSLVAILFLVSCLMSQGDYNTAGTYLGEVSDKIEGGFVTHPNVIRFYKAQLIRYQDRK